MVQASVKCPKTGQFPGDPKPDLYNNFYHFRMIRDLETVMSEIQTPEIRTYVTWLFVWVFLCAHGQSLSRSQIVAEFLLPAWDKKQVRPFYITAKNGFKGEMSLPTRKSILSVIKAIEDKLV